MAKFALDTNVLIDALNLPHRREALLGFLRWALPTTHLSSVVVLEVTAGAASRRQQALLDQQIVGPFLQRGRVFAPSITAWLQAGRALARGHRIATAAALNDLLLATSCREAGLTLVTSDAGLGRLTKLIPGLSVAQPFPKPPTRS